MNSTILLVEDESLLAMTLRNIFESLGFEVVGRASTYESAVTLAMFLHPDLVVMDIDLAGEKNGVDAAHTIRSFSDQPIVFHSSTADPTQIQQATSVSNTTFLPKTISAYDWSSTLNHFFDLPLLQVA